MSAAASSTTEPTDAPTDTARLLAEAQTAPALLETDTEALSPSAAVPPRRRRVWPILLLGLLALAGGGAALFFLAPELVQKYVPLATTSTPAAAPKPAAAATDTPAISPGPIATASATAEPTASASASTTPEQAEISTLDRAAAERALAAAAVKATRCSQGGRDLTGTADVTFTPEGKISDVRVSGSLAGSPVERCVKITLEAARVKAFTGPATTLTRDLVVPGGRAQPAPRPPTPTPTPSPAPTPTPTPTPKPPAPTAPMPDDSPY